MEEFDPKVAEDDRRAFLSKFGKAALVAPPAISMLLSTSMSSPAIARSTGGPSLDPKGNNGVGNGYDPQPPGNPKENDGDGTNPGNPGNGGGGGNGNLNANANGNGNGNGNNGHKH